MAQSIAKYFITVGDTVDPFNHWVSIRIFCIQAFISRVLIYSARISISEQWNIAGLSFSLSTWAWGSNQLCMYVQSPRGRLSDYRDFTEKYSSFMSREKLRNRHTKWGLNVTVWCFFAKKSENSPQQKIWHKKCNVAKKSPFLIAHFVQFNFAILLWYVWLCSNNAFPSTIRNWIQPWQSQS